MDHHWPGEAQSGSGRSLMLKLPGIFQMQKTGCWGRVFKVSETSAA